MVERHMYWLLAHRLEIEENKLPALQYFPLVKLALGGDTYQASLVKILALNDLRNALSHEIDPSALESAYATFCRKLGTFWPEPSDVVNSADLQRLRDMSTRVAAFSCPIEVWVHMAELSLNMQLYASESEADESRKAIDLIRSILDTAKSHQSSLQQVWNRLSQP